MIIPANTIPKSKRYIAYAILSEAPTWDREIVFTFHRTRARADAAVYRLRRRFADDTRVIRIEWAFIRDTHRERGLLL